MGADKAAREDAQERLDTVMSASKGIIERMAREYELSRDLVDSLNVSVRLKLGGYTDANEGIPYNTGLAEAAITGFRSILEHAVGNPDVEEVLLRDYKEELFSALKL